jgi:hypothetical protein
VPLAVAGAGVLHVGHQSLLRLKFVELDAEQPTLQLAARCPLQFKRAKLNAAKEFNS